VRELLILCFAYAISLFYRGMISVIAPEISADLSLDETGLGLLSSSFFISFAIAQIPCGLALDRFGSRLTIGLFMWLAVIGIALFSMAINVEMAFAGQVLIGIGCAPIFTGTMLFIGRRYSTTKFAYYTALVIAIGGLGDLLGTTPLALLAEWLGWRYALLGPLLLTVLASSFCLLGLKSEQRASEKQSFQFMLKGMVSVTRVQGLWPIVPLFLSSYAVLMAIRGLWSGPYLFDIFTLDAGSRGNIILAMAISMGIGTFMLGLLDRFLQRTKWLVMASSILMVIPLLILAVYPDIGANFSMWVFVVMGLFGFNYPLLMAHCRSFLATEYHGRGMALLTALAFAGIAIIQASSGWMMQKSAEMGLVPAEQYQYLFLFLAGVLGLACVVYGFSEPSGTEDHLKSSKIPSSGVR